jgi:hypothetical protein
MRELFLALLSGKKNKKLVQLELTVPACYLLCCEAKNTTIGKSKNFSGQPIFSQLIKFIDKSEIARMAKGTKQNLM